MHVVKAWPGGFDGASEDVIRSDSDGQAAIHAMVIASVLEIHAEEAASLHESRKVQAKAPHVDLGGLARLDARLSAHLDGLATAREHVWRICEQALTGPSRGAAFTAAVRAIEDGRTSALDRLWVAADDHRSVREGVVSAFGWVEPCHLQGIVRDLLMSGDAVRYAIGVAACVLHQVDPYLTAKRETEDSQPVVQAAALRAAGQLGRRDLLPACTSGAADADLECRFWGAWSAVLLGSRGTGLDILTDIGLAPGPHRKRAFGVSLLAMHPDETHALLQQLSGAPGDLRWLIQGSGIAGNPAYVPWLIGHMAAPQTARAAAEAFMTITGLDLFQGFEVERPDGYDGGPTEDPEDENVELDPDEGLPWPDRDRIQAWWAKNDSRFRKGQRYFMGAPVTSEHCIDVLKNGYQRQRILAAHHLCLLEPGTPLFNTSAPAWRQRRLLAQMK